MCTCMIESKAVHSSAFPPLSGIVQHFDVVNHLDTVETGHMQTPCTCLCPQAGQGPENEALHPLDLWMASHKTTI